MVGDDKRLGFHVVAVHSNKGGVGKSTIAANLAIHLQRLGHRVGILDADLDSPYLVEIGGIVGKVTLDDQRRMIPVRWHGMPVMSFALWVPDQFQGASMAGETHERWIEDALLQTEWGDIEVLVVDMSPGSSDEYLALKRVCGSRLLGMVAVAMPNVVSGLERVFNLAAYHSLRILCVVENMSGKVFGEEGKVQRYCELNSLTFAGSVPLDSRIRTRHESGDPEVPGDAAGAIVRASELVIKAVGAS